MGVDPYKLSPPLVNWILIDESAAFWLIMPLKEVVMQPRLTVGILVLQAEGLVCAIRYLGFSFRRLAVVADQTDCHPYRSSRAVYRFGRSGSGGRFSFTVQLYLRTEKYPLRRD